MIKRIAIIPGNASLGVPPTPRVVEVPESADSTIVNGFTLELVRMGTGYDAVFLFADRMDAEHHTPEQCAEFRRLSEEIGSVGG